VCLPRVCEADSLPDTCDSDETHSNLVELTKKLAALALNEYALNDYVEDKAMQSDYRQAKENVVQMTTDLNRFTQSQVW
jgi:hypothetical protein